MTPVKRREKIIPKLAKTHAIFIQVVLLYIIWEVLSPLDLWKDKTVYSSLEKQDTKFLQYFPIASEGRQENGTNKKNTSSVFPKHVDWTQRPQVSPDIKPVNNSLCHIKGVVELVKTFNPYMDDPRKRIASKIVNHYGKGRIWPRAVHDQLELYSSLCAGPLPADLILVMHSGTDLRSIKRRAQARKTWLQANAQLKYRVIVFFSVALSKDNKTNTEIKEEAKKHRDMLIFDFRDSFRNLTLKTMSTFEWIAQNCSKARFILKTDEDTFVNFTKILQYLPRVSKTLGVLGSAFGILDSIVYRDPKFKFGVPKEQYPYKYFGPYASGRGYLMSMKTLKLIVRASAFIPVIDMEDAYVGKCNQCLGLKTMSVYNFACHYRENDKSIKHCAVIHDMPAQLRWTNTSTI